MTHNLSYIIEELIENSFRELLNKKIGGKYVKLYHKPGDNLLLFEEDKYFRIYVDVLLKKVPKKVLQGGIAHELSHISNRLKLSKYLHERDDEMYPRSLIYRFLDERNTDLEVILRGYGSHLIKFLEYTDKYKSKKSRTWNDSGLTLEEVKKLVGNRKPK